MPTNSHELGAQPLDALMTKWEISNQDLVKASTQQLTFKQVQKARAGRPVTVNIQNKILRALNACNGKVKCQVQDLFNYY